MLEKVFISVVVGLMGLFPVVLQRLSNKRREKGYSNQLKKLQVELDFLEKWKNFSSTINNEENNNSEQIIGSSLNTILEQYMALNEAEIKFDQQDGVTDIKQISILRRLFLLFWPKSFTGWILHSLFYFLLIFSTVMVMSELISPTIDEVSGESELFNLLLGTVMLFGIPAFVIQRYAIKRIKNDFKENT